MGGADVSPIISLSEAQAYVRIETGDEEALLAGLIRTASALCETFLNQVVIARSFTETLRANGSWQRLGIQPVRSVAAIRCGDQALSADEYGLDIDASGTAWVKLPAGLKCTVEGAAGLAADENEVPEPVRQGVVRLTAHLFGQRDGSSNSDPPAIVTALWRPYRRLVLV